MEVQTAVAHRKDLRTAITSMVDVQRRSRPRAVGFVRPLPIQADILDIIVFEINATGVPGVERVRTWRPSMTKTLLPKPTSP
jgi:hypothetical protein